MNCSRGHECKDYNLLPTISIRSLGKCGALLHERRTEINGFRSAVQVNLGRCAPNSRCDNSIAQYVAPYIGRARNTGRPLRQALRG
jgi:hypothetical protein